MRLSWRLLRCVLTLGVLAVILAFFILPELRRTDLSPLAHLGAVWLVTGTLLEGASLVCYSLLTRSLLPARSLPLGTVIRVDLACTALCHAVPGGSAGGSSATGCRPRPAALLMLPCTCCRAVSPRRATGPAAGWRHPGRT